MKKNNQFEIVHDLPVDKWSAFVKEHPSGNIFQTWEMHQVFSKTKGYTPHVTAALDETGNILALIPAVNVTLYPQFYPMLSTRSISYGGILLNEDPQINHELFNIYTSNIKNKALFIEFRNHIDMNQFALVLKDNDFEFEDHINYEIDTTPDADDIWKNFSNQARRNIKKSQKAGLTIKDIEHADQLHILYGFLKKTFDAVKVPTPDFSLFQAIYDILLPRQMAKITLVYQQNKPLAAGLFLTFKGVMYSWYYSADDTYRKLCPTDAMIWHNLQWCHENNFHTFDFQWAGRRNETYGVRRFKEKYHGKEVVYGRHVKVLHPMIFQLSKSAYALKRLFKRGTR